MNKIIIELLLPIETETAEKVLLEQTEFLISSWRDMLNFYKARGVAVPTVLLKRPKGTVPPQDVGKKEFFTTLIDHHLKYMPKDNVAAQMKAIKALYATGKTTEELIELYEKSRESYKLTSWFTVKYNLSKPESGDNLNEEVAFERKLLDEAEKESIINRLKGD